MSFWGQLKNFKSLPIQSNIIHLKFATPLGIVIKPANDDLKQNIKE